MTVIPDLKTEQVLDEIYYTETLNLKNEIAKDSLLLLHQRQRFVVYDHYHG